MLQECTKATHHHKAHCCSFKEMQTLPFSIWRCRELPDQEVDEQSLSAMEQSREKILTRLLALTHGQDEVRAQLRSDHWQKMPVQAFSFAVAGLLVGDANLAQQLLESTDTRHRLEVLLGLINETA